jgi:hypothetical protein
MKNKLITEVATVQTTQSNMVSLPEPIASILKVKTGDTLYIVDVNGDTVRLFTKNSNFYKQLEAAQEAMDADAEALKLLAK